MDGEALVAGALRRSGDSLQVAGRRLSADAELVLLAAGKASDAMARGALAGLGRVPRCGLVVGKDPAPDFDPQVARRTAGHPVPDLRSAAAGEAAVALVSSTGPGDVLLVLLSGGASALLTAPQAGLGLGDLAATTDAMLRAGADIETLNTVRRHLTLASGGRLARASGAAAIHVLALSDVPGDVPALLGSGPFAADPTGPADALSALDSAGLRTAVPAVVRRYLEARVHEEARAPSAISDPAFDRVHTTVLANNRSARNAALRAASRAGFAARSIDEELEGEAAVAGRRLATLALGLGPGELLVFGGETTVQVVGDGRGGRCQELALAAALVLDGASDRAILAAGTDGTDGPTDAAGAHADGSTVARGRARGVSPEDSLHRNDAYGFFAAEGGLLRTGPTGTNVRDLVLVARAPAHPGG